MKSSKVFCFVCATPLPSQPLAGLQKRLTRDTVVDSADDDDDDDQRNYRPYAFQELVEVKGLGLAAIRGHHRRHLLRVGK